MSEFPHAPLDPQERALAEALDRLPKLDPGEKLDAWVLAAARAERHVPVPRRPNWLAASIGAVALAVMAIGITWQASLHDPLWHWRTPEVPHEDTSDRVEVEIGEHDEAGAPRASGRAVQEAAPAAAPVASPAPHQPAPAIRARTENAAPAASKTPTATPVPRTKSVQRVSPRPAAEPASSSPEPGIARPLPAPAPPTPVRQTSGDAVNAPAPPAPAAAALRSERARDATLPQQGPASDYTLSPDLWLAQIRTLLREGKRDAAAASLRGFARHYPAARIPDDLEGLLDE